MSQTASAIANVTLPAAGTWQADPAHSSVAFTARHLVVSKVRGRFDSFTATLHVGEDPGQASVVASLDSASINTANQMRDDHLRSPDFLDAQNYPTLGFSSTSVEVIDDSRFKLHGDLTIKDVTLPVTLNAEYLGVFDDAQGGKRVAFSATTEIDRDAWGITYNMALEAGGLLVSKKIGIELDIQATLVS